MLRCLLLMAAAVPLCSQPVGVAHIPLPADLSGTLHGTPYRIRVPANWNGTLLVYAHGYYTATPPVVEIAPSLTLEDQLLSLGYALAGSQFANSEKDAIEQTHALTSFFDGAVGKPRRVIVWGSSFGGLMAVMLIEKHHETYAAAIAASGVLGGNPKFMDAELRLSLAYAAAFGWPADTWGPIGDLRDDLNFFTDVYPVVQWPSPETYGRWEFIRLVMKLPPAAWWEPSGFPGLAYQMFFATEFRARLERECGGPVAQNLGAVYTLTDGEKAYLAGLGVSNANDLLASMNAQANIVASRSAREHLAHYGQPTGDLRRPIVTLHGTLDGVAWVFNESAYRVLVDAEGNGGDKLVQVYVDGPIHGSFTDEQYLAAVAAVISWLDTGVRPDASFFPVSEEFDTSFVPPPWPY